MILYRGIILLYNEETCAFVKAELRPRITAIYHNYSLTKDEGLGHETSKPAPICSISITCLHFPYLSFPAYLLLQSVNGPIYAYCRIILHKRRTKALTDPFSGKYALFTPIKPYDNIIKFALGRIWTLKTLLCG